MKCSRLLLSVLLLSSASAEEIRVPLVGLGWQISFEGPVMKQANRDFAGGAFQWKANAGKFNASLFVEAPPKDAPANATHPMCRDFYWPQAKRNPTITAESVKMITRPNCEAVAYRTKGEFKGTTYVMDHVNCYFVIQGKWADLHVSIINPNMGETQQLTDFAKGLSYGPWQADEVRAVTHVLGKLGTVSFTPPKGWMTGSLLKDDMDPEHPKYTVSFFSPTAPNSNCLVTLFSGPNVPDSVESLHKAIESSTQSMQSQSVEGKAVIRDIKLKRGMGAVASFTDASLVGKPIDPGNAKALATGLIVPKDHVLGVVSMFMDEANGADAVKMVETLATLTLD